MELGAGVPLYGRHKITRDDVRKVAELTACFGMIEMDLPAVVVAEMLDMMGLRQALRGETELTLHLDGVTSE